MRIQYDIWLTICLLFPLTAGGQTTAAVDTTAMMRDDYITASLLIAEPAHEPYSLFGHCAIRLQCPSHQMDYCFTFETSINTQGLLNFFRGKSKGGFAAAPTTDYIAYYRASNRGLTQYHLNLTPAEKLRLWQQVDEEIAYGANHRYNYLHTQCVSMIVSLVTSVLSAPVGYHQLPDQLQGSFRDQMLAESVHYPWSRFFWQTIMGPEGDETEPLEHKLTPRTLPAAWQHTTMGNESRSLITGPVKPLVAHKAPMADSFASGFTPLHACTLLLMVVCMVSVGQWRYGWKWLPVITDVILLTFYTLLALALTALVLFSDLEATRWNWYLPVFNPLPLLLWLIRPAWLSWTGRCLLAVIVLLLVLTPLVPQLDAPHALLMAAIGIRLLFIPQVLITQKNNKTESS